MKKKLLIVLLLVGVLFISGCVGEGTIYKENGETPTTITTTTTLTTTTISTSATAIEEEEEGKEETTTTYQPATSTTTTIGSIEETEYSPVAYFCTMINCYYYVDTSGESLPSGISYISGFEPNEENSEIKIKDANNYILDIKAMSPSTSPIINADYNGLEISSGSCHRVSDANSKIEKICKNDNSNVVVYWKFVWYDDY